MCQHKEIRKSGFFGRLLDVQFYVGPCQVWSYFFCYYLGSIQHYFRWQILSFFPTFRRWHFYELLDALFCIIGKIRHGERSTWKMNKHFTYLVNKFLVSSPSPKKTSVFLKNVTCFILTFSSKYIWNNRTKVYVYRNKSSKNTKCKISKESIFVKSHARKVH